MIRKTLIGIVLAFLLIEALPYLTLTALAAAHPEISAYPLHLADLSQRREVVGRPAHYTRRIYFIGNSAAWGFGVDDRLTIASRLQALLPDSLVLNLSTQDTFTMAGELLVLQETPLRPGDTVISYDGDAEFRLAYPTLPLCQTDIGALALLCHMVSSRSYDAHAKDLALTSVRRSLQLMREYVTTHGATFVHIWQSVIWTAPRSAEEQRMLSVYEANLRIDDVDFAPVLPDFRRADAASLDFTGLLDGARGRGGFMFLDSIHTTAAADDIIAKAIVGRLYGSF